MKGVGVVKESCPGGEIPSTFPSRKTWKQFKKKKKTLGVTPQQKRPGVKAPSFFSAGQLRSPEQYCLNTLCFTVPLSKMGQLWFSQSISCRAEHQVSDPSPIPHVGWPGCCTSQSEQ